MSQALDDARPEPATGASASVRALAAACAGNLVEWYDFAIYGAFATNHRGHLLPGLEPERAAAGQLRRVRHRVPGPPLRGAAVRRAPGTGWGAGRCCPR